MMRVAIYTARLCPFCMLARRLLNSKGVAYEEIPIDGDAVLRDEVATRSGQRTVPQIFVDDKPIGGYSELVALQRAGQLDDILRPPPDY